MLSVNVKWIRGVDMRKIIILLLCLVLVSCGTTNKSKSTTEHTSENSFFGVKKKVKEKLIYNALFKKIVALGYLIQQKYRNDIRNMLP